MRRRPVHILLLLSMCLLLQRAFEFSLFVRADEPDLVQTAVLQTAEDIKRDTDRLNAQRAAISAERGPLAEQLENLQRKVAKQREEAQRIRRLRAQSEQEQREMLAEAEALQEQYLFIQSVFTEYARAMETRIGTAEAPRLTQALRPVMDQCLAASPPGGLTEPVSQLLQISARINQARLGGWQFEGPALDMHGVEHEGTFVTFGPLAWFAAHTDGPAGMVIIRFGNDQPVIYPLAGKIPAGKTIQHLATGQEAVLPVDISNGDAVKIAEARSSWIDHVKKGGFVMIPLLAVGVTALLLALWKMIELLTIRIEPGANLFDVLHHMKQGNLPAAQAAAELIPEPLALLVREAILHHDAPREHLEELMHEQVLGILPRLERHLGTLAVLGGVAPLLGLLGTVTGMIHTFQLVTLFGSGDPRLLSGGISEALVTTEFGLAIAIPVLLIHAFLARRSRTLLAALEKTAVTMVNDLNIRQDAS